MMTKAYSNKALPSGTVLREWRIEDVLGVGGFGIVYRARGIYFDELVAIKEYFPSSISERDSEDTVVPIDSDAEEVHALGLKKFVEEAKLLWNLSTPTRHPNIVSVRSLFEIHGTAYMVMDFEDGMSLSRMLKQGRRFNERSLWNILHPIAEGLERAHRVGVLHRDIKPPNILINEDNRPVLIDFGSARFEAAEATSTKVTFHTPPYAAIEQYVKTYEQGPWTDIYALGVVMYECVTGEKPPEVLERLHAGLGKPLSDGKWSGYGKRFLAAIDAAMIVKPDERPQSIGAWLETFGKQAEQASDDGDDEATRFFAGQVETDDIVPVPATPDVDPKAVETGVPADPKEASFKLAGEETAAKRKIAPKRKADEPRAGAQSPSSTAGKADARAASAAAAAKVRRPRPAMLAGAAIALLAAVGIWALTLRGGSPQPVQGVSDLPSDLSEGSVINVEAAQPAVANGNEVVDATTENASEKAGDDAGAAAALRSERAEAKAAAAEARLAASKRAAARKAAQEPVEAATAPNVSVRTAGKLNAYPDRASQASAGSGVSPANLREFYSIVDDARSMAKKVIRKGNSQNAALARGYDDNLKLLRPSIGGVRSDKEAERLIKQAKQTRAYVQFLYNQQ
jgi:serine/threonine protein kinase